MDKHTPEPWTNNCSTFIETESGIKIAQTFNRRDENFENVHANAARIVACVNACAGIENPQEFWDSARAAVLEGVKLKSQIEAEQKRFACKVLYEINVSMLFSGVFDSIKGGDIRNLFQDVLSENGLYEEYIAMVNAKTKPHETPPQP